MKPLLSHYYFIYRLISSFTAQSIHQIQYYQAKTKFIIYFLEPLRQYLQGI